jgi:hypothetical protein
MLLSYNIVVTLSTSSCGYGESREKCECSLLPLTDKYRCARGSVGIHERSRFLESLLTASTRNTNSSSGSQNWWGNSVVFYILDSPSFPFHHYQHRLQQLQQLLPHSDNASCAVRLIPKRKWYAHIVHFANQL